VIEVKLRKWLVVMLSVMLVVLAACSNSNPSGGNEGGGDKEGGADLGKEVTLKIMLPGDRPQDLDKIVAAAEQKMKEDGLNYKLNFVFVPWADLASKTQVTLTSGEEIDMIYDAPWLHINQMTSEGYYTDLTDLIKEHGQNILNAGSELIFEANKFNGKMTAIPLGSKNGHANSIIIRKDIREELGLEEVKTHEQFIEFLRAVKEKKPEIIPYSAWGVSPDLSYAGIRIENDYEAGFRVTPAFNRNFTLYLKGNDPTVYNLFDEMDPTIWSYIELTRSMYQEGLINPDIMSSPDSKVMLKSGEIASMTYTDFSMQQNTLRELQANVPGADLEIFELYKFEKNANTSDYKQNDYLAIPKASKNPVDAIKFLNWAHEQDNYNLISFGIEGEHWEAVGDTQYKPLKDSYPWFGWSFLWAPKYHKFSAEFSPEDLAKNEFYYTAENFEKDVLTGFTFDTSPIANEIAQFNSIDAKYYPLIMNGVVDPAEAWDKYKKEGEAVVKKIQNELQAQIQTFLDGQK
jgi:putative aldouronate transport system substrate-binding protein